MNAECDAHQLRYGRGRRNRDAPFMDTRTGLAYCHECLLALIEWEQDGRPDTGDDGFPGEQLIPAEAAR